MASLFLLFLTKWSPHKVKEDKLGKREINEPV